MMKMIFKFLNEDGRIVSYKLRNIIRYDFSESGDSITVSFQNGDTKTKELHDCLNIKIVSYNIYENDELLNKVKIKKN